MQEYVKTEGVFRMEAHFLGQATQAVKSQRLGRDFETFLGQAAQVVKMDDLRAMGSAVQDLDPLNGLNIR